MPVVVASMAVGGRQMLKQWLRAHILSQPEAEGLTRNGVRLLKLQSLPTEAHLLCQQGHIP